MDNKIALSAQLINLAKEFKNNNSKLYIVGGFVRDFLLNNKNDDIDICGNLGVDKVLKICKKLNLKTNVINNKLGTLQISYKDEKYEYTCFRVEEYEMGKHSPHKVDFVNDIEKDCKRRDFSCNSIYYDVLEDKIIDPYNGVRDVKRKLLKTVETPMFVFKSDGLRVLRLIRFSSVLNFKVENKTLKMAKQQAHLLKDISAERKLKELQLIFEKNKAYEIAISLINKLNLYKYIFNSTFKKIKINKNTGFYKCFKLEGGLGFKVFILNILNDYFKHKATNLQQIEYVSNVLLGKYGIKCSKSETSEIIKIFYVANVLLNIGAVKNNESSSFNIFCIMNYLTLINYSEIFKVINNKKYCLIIDNINLLKHKQVPFNMNELKLNNAALIANKKITNININKIKQKCFELCLMSRLNNNEKELMEFAENYNKQLNLKNKTSL